MDPQKVEHEYESGYGSRDELTPQDNKLKLDEGGARDGSGDRVDPPN